MQTLTWTQTHAPLSTAVSYATPNKYGIIDISPHTITWMAYAATRLLKYIGDMEITAVSARNVSSWIENEASRPISPNTANSYLRAVKTRYSRLQRNGITGHNPAAAIKPFPSPRPTPKAIAYSDYVLMLNTAESQRDKAILSTLWATGCRVGGLLSMRIDTIESWYDNNGSVCYALYVEEKGKNGRTSPRWTYAKGSEAQALQRWLNKRPTADTPNIFTTQTSRPRPLKSSGLSSVFRRIRATAGLETTTNPHSFRHAYAIRMLDDGYDIAMVSQLLGHTDASFTAKTYAVRSESQLRAAYFRHA